MKHTSTGCEHLLAEDASIAGCTAHWRLQDLAVAFDVAHVICTRSCADAVQQPAGPLACAPAHAPFSQDGAVSFYSATQHAQQHGVKPQSTASTHVNASNATSCETRQRITPDLDMRSKRTGPTCTRSEVHTALLNSR